MSISKLESSQSVKRLLRPHLLKSNSRWCLLHLFTLKRNPSMKGTRNLLISRLLSYLLIIPCKILHQEKKSLRNVWEKDHSNEQGKTTKYLSIHFHNNASQIIEALNTIHEKRLQHNCKYKHLRRVEKGEGVKNVRFLYCCFLLCYFHHSPGCTP